MAIQPKLPVIVIFDHKRARLRCPRQDLEPSLRRHHDAEWKLMCRSDVKSFRSGITPPSRMDGDPVLVEWHRNELHPSIAKRYHRAEIARIFHPHCVSRP